MSRVDILTSYLAAKWRGATLHGAKLERWQQRRALTLVQYVRNHSAFYRELWNEKSDSEWRDFPTVDKAQMMASFDTFTTIGVSRDVVMQTALHAEAHRDFSAVVRGCTVGLSSGTSGHRGVFLVSEEEQTRWAGTILARAIPDLRPGHRVAFFLRANSRLYERTSSVVQFRFFDLMQPLSDVIASLNAFRPQLVVGPPSLLGLLADAKRGNTLHIAPSRMISVAEVIEPQDRGYIEATFQAPVGEVYQCTEGLVAVSCRHGSLHVQEDVMVMQSEAVVPSEPSRVTPVLTDLWRRTQPIIRYRLGDVLQMDTAPCVCGSSWRRIAAIEGRQDDLCWFPQRDETLRVVFPDAIRRMILLADDRVLQYRALQSSAGTLDIGIELARASELSDVSHRIVASVHIALAEYGCRASAVTVHAQIPALAPGEKRRRVICTWRRNGLAHRGKAY